jgi:hypothetical protein
MHAMLVRWVDALTGPVEGSAEEAELEAIADCSRPNEAERWPLGKIPGARVSWPD